VGLIKLLLNVLIGQINLRAVFIKQTAGQACTNVERLIAMTHKIVIMA
jgi:hypothetical protein